ncbi:hypothetical protein HPC49_06655 [Pyxidicoccus fallax]|uniref:Uncharacterized protein n=1 Tax=Pyxidicoccus fallax TaxID=394095 RepID=A0A848LFN2_9BACT|nr:hypothetical protein [Pyxidicoccus fallax]NMO17304.1 hypothetical protein [Pyxidicoccus fallax]NPC77933.1 hypothetical protein [Pyxidicoccus fallax]
MAKRDEKEQQKRDAGGETGYAEDIKHVQATRPDPWPGIEGRSKGEEDDLPTGTPREEQADVTQAQRQLEKDMDGVMEEPTRE